MKEVKVNNIVINNLIKNIGEVQEMLGASEYELYAAICFYKNSLEKIRGIKYITTSKGDIFEAPKT